MKIADVSRIATLTALLCWLGVTNSLEAQTTPPVAPTTPGGPSIDSINTEFEKGVVQLERQRLERLGKLALSQPKDQALATFDAYFRLAIARNLYADADPIALKVIQSEDPSSGVVWLAHLVHIVGEADRGAYDDSLKSLARAIRLKGQQPGAATKDAQLPVTTRASIIDAYYQRLIHGDQIEVARKAMKLVVDTADVAAIRDFAARRLKQLDLVGRAAPTIAGVDLEGKPFRLDAMKGEVVLVVFWATWCLPNSQEMPWIDHLYRTHHGQGFRVVGINLDSPQDAGPALQAAMPNIRRYLLDRNVTWPTLINGPGDHDYASALGVTEIPANILVGRDGKVTHLDLTGRKLEKAIVESVAQKP